MEIIAVPTYLTEWLCIFNEVLHANDDIEHVSIVLKCLLVRLILIVTLCGRF